MRGKAHKREGLLGPSLIISTFIGEVLELGSIGLYRLLIGGGFIFDIAMSMDCCLL